MKTLFSIFFLGMSLQMEAQHKTVAQQAFDAWGIGEKTGNYAAFKALLSTNFVTFSHPLNGTFSGKAALKNMQSLIESREKTSNELNFTNVKLMENGLDFAFAFDSEGKVSGGFPYKGFNIIVFSVENQKLTGFREYFGFVDPNWFKK